MAEYIEREALIAEFKRRKLGENSFIEKVFADGVYVIIEQFHAADVSPVVHSYWEHKITNDGENIGICHNCKYPVSWFWEQAKYCLNCGAKMDGDDTDGEHDTTAC